MSSSSDSEFESLVDLLRFYISNNTLVRLEIVRAKGVRLSIPCRILNWDESQNTITVYHVDEKSVYIINLNEIDEFRAQK